LAKVRKEQQGDREKAKRKEKKAGEQNRVCCWVQPMSVKGGGVWIRYPLVI
jgi:hypothetical protein